MAAGGRPAGGGTRRIRPCETSSPSLELRSLSVNSCVPPSERVRRRDSLLGVCIHKNCVLFQFVNVVDHRKREPAVAPRDRLPDPTPSFPGSLRADASSLPRSLLPCLVFPPPFSTANDSANKLLLSLSPMLRAKAALSQKSLSPAVASARTSLLLQKGHPTLPPALQAGSRSMSQQRRTGAAAAKTTAAARSATGRINMVSKHMSSSSSNQAKAAADKWTNVEGVGPDVSRAFAEGVLSSATVHCQGARLSDTPLLHFARPSRVHVHTPPTIHWRPLKACRQSRHDFRGPHPHLEPTEGTQRPQ